MKRAILVLIVLCLGFVAGSAALYAQTTHFEPKFIGQNLPTPIDQDKFVKAARMGLARYHWRLMSDEAGELRARFQKSNITCDIRIVYDSKGYYIEYVDSVGLDANLDKKKIHRNYPRWIANLDKYIYTNYLR
jgi:hypothetical protein